MNRTPNKIDKNTETGATCLTKYSTELLINELQSRGYQVFEVPEIEVPEIDFDLSDVDFDNIDLSGLKDFENDLATLQARKRL